MSGRRSGAVAWGAGGGNGILVDGSSPLTFSVGTGGNVCEKCHSPFSSFYL